MNYDPGSFNLRPSFVLSLISCCEKEGDVAKTAPREHLLDNIVIAAIANKIKKINLDDVFIGNR